MGVHDWGGIGTPHNIETTLLKIQDGFSTDVVVGWVVPIELLYKTWTLVSNSSLRKTFALCMQFRKPQVQKLRFIPPKIIFIEVHFWLEKILGLKFLFGGVLLVVLVPLVTWAITP